MIMATPAIQELDALLLSLQSLKPPGVNKAKVDAVTRICTDPQNVQVRTARIDIRQIPNHALGLSTRQVEHLLVDTLVNAFRRSPADYKLGVLYVVDAVSRQWV